MKVREKKMFGKGHTPAEEGEKNYKFDIYVYDDQGHKYIYNTKSKKFKKPKSAKNY